MSAIVVYGSLINKDQLAKESSHCGEASPVLVHGYQRVFNQEPSWREGHEKRRAVLNVIPSKKHVFNGVLLPLRDSKVFHDLDERERGYDRVRLECSQLAQCAGLPFPSQTDSIFIYRGKLDKRNDDMLPNEHYLNLCLDGAKQWGEEFHELFLQTTYVGETSLKKFLQHEP